MYKVKKIVSCFILCALIFSLCACGKERGIGSTDNDVYEEIIGGLEDNELFAMIDTNAPLPVLLVTSQVFDDGTGKQASIACDVYYPIDKEVKNIGTVESMGQHILFPMMKQASMRLPITVCSVLRLINPVPLSWQKEFMSNLMKMEMLLISWKKRM